MMPPYQMFLNLSDDGAAATDDAAATDAGTDTAEPAADEATE